MDPIGNRSREQSGIAFPYVDLYAAVEVAQAIHSRSGDRPCDLNDLANDLGGAVGGAFRLKTSAARIFELVEKRGRSEVLLTDTGRHVVAEPEAKRHLANAFLRVPLYAAVFDKYRSSRLPARRELEEQMKSLGVPGKQVDKARQVFERSARQAGLLDSSSHRLIFPQSAQPQIGNTSPVAAQPMMSSDERLDAFPFEAGLTGRFHRDDPLILGLIERLPIAGSSWSDEARVAWLRLASSIFDVTYTDGQGEIRIALTDDTKS